MIRFYWSDQILILNLMADPDFVRNSRKKWTIKHTMILNHFFILMLKICFLVSQYFVLSSETNSMNSLLDEHWAEVEGNHRLQWEDRIQLSCTSLYNLKTSGISLSCQHIDSNAFYTTFRFLFTLILLVLFSTSKWTEKQNSMCYHLSSEC